MGADLLERAGPSCPDALRGALACTARQARRELATTCGCLTSPHRGGCADDSRAECHLALDPTFRAQELSFAVSQIASNIDLAAAAERRSWIERLLGRQP